MERPKQQAIAFLLGAVLVGGVVGFSADRMIRQPEETVQERRQRMYDDLGLAPTQRVALDSVFDSSNCQLDALYAPLQPAYDSIKAVRRTHMDAILTPDQRTHMEVRRKDYDGRRDAERKRMKALCHK